MLQNSNKSAIKKVRKKKSYEKEFGTKNSPKDMCAGDRMRNFSRTLNVGSFVISNNFY